MKKLNLIAPLSTHTFTINPEEAGTRLDVYLVQQFPEHSRTLVQKLITSDCVKLNSKPAAKHSLVLKDGDFVEITFPAARENAPSTLSDETINNLGITLVHEHPEFLIIHKPAGVLVHPASPAHSVITLVNWILHNYPTIGGIGAPERPGIVHRLDQHTSGLMIIPRTTRAHARFGQMFKDRKIQKTYLAVVHGHPEPTGTIESKITRDPVTRNKMTDRLRTGRDSVTHYRVLQYFTDFTLVEVKPVTGRTHQIRVHFAGIGHILVGDAVYGSTSKLIKRQALHAYALAFDFDGTSYQFSHEAPQDFKSLLETAQSKAF